MTTTLMEIQKDIERKVKPQNVKELPSSSQLYFLLHRAKEQGYEVAELPVRRDMAALAIHLIKNKNYTYRQAIKAVRTATALRR